MKKILMATAALLVMASTAQGASFRGLHTGMSLAEVDEVFKSEFVPDDYPLKHTLDRDGMDNAVLIIGGMRVCGKLFYTGEGTGKTRFVTRMVLQDCFWHRSAGGRNFGGQAGGGVSDIWELLTSEKAMNLKLRCIPLHSENEKHKCQGEVDGDFVELKVMGGQEVVYVTRMPGK